MRIKYKRLAKIFILFLFVLFVLPNYFDTPSVHVEVTKARADFIIPDSFKEVTKNKIVEKTTHLKLTTIKTTQKFKVEHYTRKRAETRHQIKKEEHEIINNEVGVEEAELRPGIKGNYEPNLFRRTGLGENGEGIELDQKDLEHANQSISEFGFNMVVSDKLSFQRRLKDTRLDECKYITYPNSLPKASIVIVFHNEGWSTLIRTVYSVINTVPKNLLSNIVLVDDYSNKEHLKDKLDTYVRRWHDKVILYHTDQRVGLIYARMIGAMKATGDVLVFLDAHCECVINWLPPLLARIKLNRKAIAVPIVDGIDWKTFAHQDIYEGTLKRGIWEWGFLYKETSIPDKEQAKRMHGSDPYLSPTLAGGMLAIEKKWFFEIGGYDTDIKVYGGEAYELSFKVWQCGGVVEFVPCSHVAHLYRGPRKESQHPPGSHPYQSNINYIRVAQVWMDEYAKYYFVRFPEYQHMDYGEITEQKKMREKLNCKSFKWFMENIAYDVLEKFPLPPDNKFWGECHNMYNLVCLTIHGFGNNLGVSKCKVGRGQIFLLNAEGQLSSGEHCLFSDGDAIKNIFCLDEKSVWLPVGEWSYIEDKQQIYSKKANKCFSTDGENLKLSDCSDNEPSQQWLWNEEFHR